MRKIKRDYVTMRVSVATTRDIDNSQCKIYRTLGQCIDVVGKIDSFRV